LAARKPAYKESLPARPTRVEVQKRAKAERFATLLAMRLLLALLLLAGLLHAEAWLVLPLFNKSDRKSLNWIGEAPAEAIRRNLAARGVMVISRENRLEAELRLALRPNVEWTIASILKLAESLDSTHVVFGAFEVLPAAAGSETGLGKVRLSTQLVAVHEFAVKDKRMVEGPLEDLEALITKLTWQTLHAAETPGLPAEQVFAESNPKRKVTAIENFVRGLLSDDLTQRQKFLEQALKIEPRYSQAAFRLGQLLVEREAYGPAAGYLERVQRPDPNFWQATFLLGIARFEIGEYRAAAQAFELVAREVPLAEVVNNLGVAQFRAGMNECVDNARRALEDDEKDADYHFNLGLIQMSRAAWAQAAEEFRAVLDRDANDAEATKLLGRCLRPPAGVSPALLAELQNLSRLKPEFNEFAYRQLRSIFDRTKKVP